MLRSCRHLCICLALAYCFASVSGFIDTLYCGKENCYDVLEVNRESTKEEIGKAYRSLARKNHPDRFKTREDKDDAEVRFRLIATAYETLRDDDARADYNYMLDNPDEYYQIYYRYYRRRVAPKVDIRVIVLVSITVISGIQYYVLWSRYNDAIKYLAKDPKYRSRAIQSAMDEGTWTFDKKKQRGKTREEIKEEEDAAVRVILESKMDIKGGYGKPTYKDILWVQIVLLPYSIYKFIGFYVRWIYRYKYQKLDYEEDDKLYLIRKNLKYSQTQWEAMPEKEREETVQKELWKDDNFKKWKKEKDEKTKAELAQNGKYKAYRRWMKKGGAGQITFGPDE